MKNEAVTVEELETSEIQATSETENASDSKKERKTYRLDPINAKFFDDTYKIEGFDSVNDFFTSVRLCYQLNESIKTIPGSSNNTMNFITFLNGLKECFCIEISDFRLTQERILQEKAAAIEAKDAKINELRDERNEQDRIIEELKNSYMQAEGECTRKDNELSAANLRILEKDKALADKQIIIDNLAAKLPEQAEIDAKFKEQEAEIQSLRNGLSDARTAQSNAESECTKLKGDISQIKSQAERASKDYQKEIETLQTNHKKDIETLKKQAEADLRTAIAKAIQEERDKAQEKIDKLLQRIDILNETILHNEHTTSKSKA